MWASYWAVPEHKQGRRLGTVGRHGNLGMTQLEAKYLRHRRVCLWLIWWPSTRKGKGPMLWDQRFRLRYSLGNSDITAASHVAGPPWPAPALPHSAQMQD